MYDDDNLVCNWERLEFEREWEVREGCEIAEPTRFYEIYGFILVSVAK